MTVMNVAVNGLGRIGRQVLRVLASNPQLRANLRVVAVNDPGPGGLQGFTRLLRMDSVHGKFPVEVKAVGADILKIEGFEDIAFLANREIPGWGEMAVKLVLESSGRFTKAAEARKHLKTGLAERILVSAPADGADATLVFGVNHRVYDRTKHYIVSGASCTTNCLAPVAMVLDQEFGLLFGIADTIHAFTGDQVVLDGPHTDPRRARASSLSMIPTSTGAAKAIGLVLPGLAGKLDGKAWRVPTPDGSAVDLKVRLRKEPSVDEINGALRAAAESGELVDVLGFSDEPGFVSRDVIGDQRPSLVDALLTKKLPGDMYNVVSWYDNELGYATQYVRLASHIASQAE